MKKWSIYFYIFLSVWSGMYAKQKLAVFDIHTDRMIMTPEQMGNLLRLEVDKLGLYEVLDKYDVNYLAAQEGLTIKDCFGKTCLTEKGAALKVDMVMGGSVEALGEVIVVSLKLIRVDSSKLEKSYIREYVVPASNIKAIVELSVKEMFGQKVDPDLLKRLTKDDTFESTFSEPYAERLRLSGPRMGFTHFTGATASIMSSPNAQGGYDASPTMFQFGYQFETQYLNQGNYQGLFEFVPMLTGMDQGLVIPSVTIINGLRNNKYGWEIGMGPTFSLIQLGKGYYDASHAWVLVDDKDTLPAGMHMEHRIDSRSEEYRLMPGFIIAAGKSFRSGKLNIPINLYLMPHKSGLRFGASFGFNGKGR